MAETLKISITDKDYSKMVIDGKNQETLKQIKDLQNSRVDTFNSDGFSYMFWKACSSGVFSSKRKVQNLISDSQKLVKDLKDISKEADNNINAKIGELNKKIQNLNPFAYPSGSQENDECVVEIKANISKLEQLAKQHADIIENLKTQKREVKGEALKSNIASEKTLENARKYMENTLLNTQKTVTAYIEKKKSEHKQDTLNKNKNADNNSTKTLVEMLNTINKKQSSQKSVSDLLEETKNLTDLLEKMKDEKDPKGWILNYKKIEACSKTGIDDKKMRPAIKEAIKAGEKIQKKLELLSADKEIDLNYTKVQESEADRVKKLIDDSADSISKKYKWNSKSDEKSAYSLIRMAIATNVLNGMAVAAITQTKLVNKKIKSLDIAKLEKYLKELDDKKNSKKLVNKKLYRYNISRFNTGLNEVCCLLGYLSPFILFFAIVLLLAVLL